MQGSTKGVPHTSSSVIDLLPDELLLEAMPPEGMLTLPPASGLSNHLAAPDCRARR